MYIGDALSDPYIVSWCSPIASPRWTLGPFESTRKHNPKCILVELDHRDLLQEDEEFERQKLVAEIAEELRPH